ncbi:MAG TPA: hypothetical protein VFV52_01875 [Bacilli bacterium]|nr:hypothetical protein [Bacilli bacterium]
MSDLVKKLRIPAEGRALILNAPEGYLADTLGPLPEGVELSIAWNKETGSYDFVQVFVHSIADLAEWAPKVTQAVKYDALLWVCYPKKSGKIKTDITRDVGWEPMTDLEYVLVSLVSVDTTWSAARVRPAAVSARGKQAKTKA